MNKFKYNNYLMSFDYISKLPIYNQKEIPSIKKAQVSINLKVISEYDIRIVHALLFSDWLTGQRGFVKSLKFIYKHNKPVIQIIITTTLRKKILYNFFEYLNICYFDILSKKLTTTKVTLLSNGFNFFIKDINFFYNIPNYLYNFNDQIQVKFFINDHYSRINLQLFLSYFVNINKYLK